MYTIIGADGKEYGPVTADMVRAWLAAGRANAETKIRREGETEWTTIGALPELAAPAGPAMSTPSAPEQTPRSTPAPAPASTAGHLERFQFTGKWEEYFKIWIVNLLLTIVTLGIYAAWAKVRNRRYLCANTKLFGHSFDYLADPVRILIGNIVVVVLYFSFVLSAAISPYLQLGVMLLVLPVIPWFIVRGLSFNARNTAWRGLRFQFHGRYSEALKAFILWPMLLPFTFGLIWPYVIRRQKDFLVNNHSYGGARFEFSALTSELYGIFWRALAFFLPLIAGYFSIFVGAVVSAAQRGAGAQPPVFLGVFVGLLMLVAFPLAIAGSFYLRSRLFNFVWNHTSIKGHEFCANMRARDLFITQFVNSLVTMVSFGLLYPWAAIRMVEFQLNSLHVIQGGPIDQFVAEAQASAPSAIGEAASDLFDIDIGFGV